MTRAGADHRLDDMAIDDELVAIDNTTPDVLGAPVPHRFAWLQVAYDLDGLRY